jgi:hypothetical protein
LKHQMHVYDLQIIRETVARDCEELLQKISYYINNQRWDTTEVYTKTQSLVELRKALEELSNKHI